MNVVLRNTMRRQRQTGGRSSRTRSNHLSRQRNIRASAAAPTKRLRRPQPQATVGLRVRELLWQLGQIMEGLLVLALIGIIMIILLSL